MGKTDWNILYGLSFAKELRALFKDRANMKNYERRYLLKTAGFPLKERQEALELCGGWLFEHFLFSVPEEFLEDRVEFGVYVLEPPVCRDTADKSGEKQPKRKGVRKLVVSVSNGITRYDFLVYYTGRLVVKHRVTETEE